jgi:hypothetical protein
VPDRIPGEWLSAAALAFDSQPAGSSSAHLARVALEAAVPLIQADGDFPPLTCSACRNSPATHPDRDAADAWLVSAYQRAWKGQA